MAPMSVKELKELNDSLHFLKMAELRRLCLKLKLPKNGKKASIIHRIVTFIKTGDVLHEAPIPDKSRAQKGGKYPLAPDTLILFGNYKNDLKTRIFIKSLVGSHFHFTAFGVDWIHDCWMKGKPPTYKQFADFWEKETKRRLESPVDPKQEWAYLSFIQRYLKDFPNASRQKIYLEWEKERRLQVKKVTEILKEKLGLK